MKDYDFDVGKYVKEVPPDGTPAHEISQSLKEISGRTKTDCRIFRKASENSFRICKFVCYRSRKV